MKFPKFLLNVKNSKYVAYIPDFKKEKTQKVSSIVFSLLALSFLGIFAINPTLSTIAKLQKDLEDSKYVSQELDKKILNLQSLQEDYSEIENDIPFVYNSVPKYPNIPNIMGQVEALGQRNNINILSIQSFEVEAIGSSNIPKDYTSFLFSINGTGDVENFNNFISSLVNIQRLISIENFSISRVSNLTNLSISFDIRAKAYFKAE